MEIMPVQYIDIRLTNKPGNNEPDDFKSIITACIKEAIKPGFKNMFSDDEKRLLANIAKGMNIEIDDSTLVVLTGDTHTNLQ